MYSRVRPRSTEDDQVERLVREGQARVPRVDHHAVGARRIATGLPEPVESRGDARAGLRDVEAVRAPAHVLVEVDAVAADRGPGDRVDALAAGERAVRGHDRPEVGRVRARGTLRAI